MHESAITMPKLSMTMEEGEVLEWEVGEGAEVAAGDVVCRIMTDKTEMDVEAPAAGRLVRVVVDPGQSVEVGTPLAYLATEERDLLAGMFDAPAPTPVSAPPPVSAPDDDVAPTGAAAASVGNGNVSVAAAPAASQNGSAVRVASVPAARSLAASLGVDICAVASPAGGIVTVDDVLAWYRSSGGAPAPTAPVADAAAPTRTSGPPSAAAPEGQMLRGRPAALARATAKTMSASAEVPQFTLHRTLDLQYASANRGGVSWNAVLVAAAAQALRSCPRINGTWTGTDVVLRTGVVLGVAVATDDGLVVVSLPEADRMPLPVLADALSAAVERARRGEMAGDDLVPPTFTVSNLGGLGVDWFAALVTPPQAAVLALGRVSRSFQPSEDGFALRVQCHAGLTVDHRVANGADGARYLAALDDQLQAGAFMQLALGSALR